MYDVSSRCAGAPVGSLDTMGRNVATSSSWSNTTSPSSMLVGLTLLLVDVRRCSLPGPNIASTDLQCWSVVSPTPVRLTSSTCLAVLKSRFISNSGL